MTSPSVDDGAERVHEGSVHAEQISNQSNDLTKVVEMSPEAFSEWLKWTPPVEVRSLLEALLSTLQQVTEERDDLLVESADLTKALTGLTRQGSEFFTRKGNRYTADIDACVSWVRMAKEDAHRRTVEALRGRNAAEAEASRWKADAATEFLARQAAEARVRVLCDELQAVATGIENQVPATRGYLIQNGIDPNFADVLLSHYLDFAMNATQARSSLLLKEVR